jgi:hypothetical protein
MRMRRMLQISVGRMRMMLWPTKVFMRLPAGHETPLSVPENDWVKASKRTTRYDFCMTVEIVGGR